MGLAGVEAQSFEVPDERDHWQQRQGEQLKGSSVTAPGQHSRQTPDLGSEQRVKGRRLQAWRAIPPLEARRRLTVERVGRLRRVVLRFPLPVHLQRPLRPEGWAWSQRLQRARLELAAQWCLQQPAQPGMKSQRERRVVGQQRRRAPAVVQAERVQGLPRRQGALQSPRPGTVGRWSSHPARASGPAAAESLEERRLVSSPGRGQFWDDSPVLRAHFRHRDLRRA